MPRKREKRIFLRVTEEEHSLIMQRVKKLGFRDMSAYLRKAAIDVTVLNINTDGLKELATQVSKVGININQITRLCNEKQNVTDTLLEMVLNNQKELVDIVKRQYDQIAVLGKQTKIRNLT